MKTFPNTKTALAVLTSQATANTSESLAVLTFTESAINAEQSNRVQILPDGYFTPTDGRDVDVEGGKWLMDEQAFASLADGYSRLSTLSKEKIITDQQARDMLEGLSDAASRNGASNADLERVYYGLSQALGAGTVNMEDFKQVTEPLPDLMAKIAKAAGQETSSGLKELIGTGTYTSEVFGKHLVEALQG